MDKNVIKIILIIIICILGMEVFLRSLESKNIAMKNYEFTENKVIFFRGKPNAGITVFSPDGKQISERLNDDGFRDINRDLSNPQNKTRILILGDSVMWGYNILFNETIHQLIEKKLSNNYPEYEIINLAVNGYTSIQEVETLKTIGLKYKPDVVILGYVINDIGTNHDGFFGSLGINYELDWEKNVLKEANMPKTCLVKNFLNKFRIINNAIGVTRNIRIWISPKSHAYNYWIGLYNNDCKWGVVSYSFLELSRISKENNFDVILAIFPYMYVEDKIEDIHSIYDKVEKEGEKNNFEILNLVAVAEKYGFKTVKLDSFHPGYEGSKIFSEEMYKKLTSVLDKRKQLNK